MGTRDKGHLGNVEVKQADLILHPHAKFLRALTISDIPSSPWCLRVSASLEIINAHSKLRALSRSMSHHEKSKEEASESVDLVEEQSRRSGVMIRGLT